MQPTLPAIVSGTRDWAVWTCTVLLVTALYLLLHHPYWVPGGDSEVYISAARNLLQGEGHTFNGQPVAMTPPGWTWVLAGAMRVSPTFAFLKLVTLFSMVGGFAIAYWICRRFTSPGISALIVVLSSVISHTYSLTYWLHSDALFFLVATASVLIAMQVGEGKPLAWRVPLLLALCAAGVMVRWAGVLHWLLVAAAILPRVRFPRLNGQSVTLGLTLLITFGTFFGLREGLRVSAEEARAIARFGGVGDDSGDFGTYEPATMPSTSPTTGPTEPVFTRADRNVSETYSLFNPHSRGFAGYVARAISWGNWYSYYYWQPTRVARSHHLLSNISIFIGWTTLLPLLIFSVHRAMKKREFLLLGAVAYSGALAMNWPHPNARYLVPFGFLLLLGMFEGTRLVIGWLSGSNWRRVFQYLLGLFLFSVVATNGALYAVEVSIARSNDFYGKYEAGLNSNLIAATRYMLDKGVGDEEIGVSESYVNLGRRGRSRFGLRATAMLTDRAIINVPSDFGLPPERPEFRSWLRRNSIKYYLYQPEVSPWRVGHFRMPWLQQRLSGIQPSAKDDSGWRLYERRGANWVKIILPTEPERLTRVPGL